MVEQLLAAAHRATEAIVREQQPDGSIGPDLSYSYKALWPLALTGRVEEATKFLGWLAARFSGVNGEFRCREGNRIYAPNQVNWRFLYPNCWLTIGALHLGRLEVALKTGAFIAGFQSQNGGFPAAREVVGDDVPQDMLSACLAGLVLMYQGELAKAERAGMFLIDLYKLQPNPDRYIYLNLSPSGRLLTEYPADRSYMYVISKERPEQPYFAPGAAMAFLSKLYMVSGKNEYLVYAERYFQMVRSPWEDIPLGLFDYPTSGKIGWGAANLYLATGNQGYRQAAERVGAYLLQAQLPDGRWPKFRDNSDVNLAAEFLTWLIEMSKCLVAR